MHRILAIIIILIGLSEKNTFGQFTPVDAEKSGISFLNKVVEDVDFNYFTYQYIYHGGGVAIGDVNGDGLEDLYFSGNAVPDHLYLNRGDFKFEEISESAGITYDDNWHTGVSMADFNQDGHLDIYVCRSGPSENPNDRSNLCYINNGNGTFIESAREMGLADSGYSTMAYLIDYDKDGYQDLYVLNHRIDFKESTKAYYFRKAKGDEFESDQLYRNLGNGKFEKVTESAGLNNKAWGLGAAVGDFNNDEWEDIYVCNDFLEPDFLYINQKDGTFKEAIGQHMKHSSFFGMGCDLADYNNDGYEDLFVLDMTPEDHVRSKRLMQPMDADNQAQLLKMGYFYQSMINTLQLNNGNGTFSEISQFAGVDKTDWSWGGVFADLDNDGLKDLYVSNGIHRDVSDRDFWQYTKDYRENSGDSAPFDEIMNLLEQTKLVNPVFRNDGDLGFDRMNEMWNLKQPENTNGFAISDLDNDGDLDIVCNNYNQAPSIYRNELEGGNFLQLEVKGPKYNPLAIGATVKILAKDQWQYQTIRLARGFQSSQSPRLHFGLGNAEEIQEVIVRYTDGRQVKLVDQEVNRKIEINYINSKGPYQKAFPLTQWVEVGASLGLTWTHLEPPFNDFEEQVLLPHKMSEPGPCIAVGDVNGDGLDDIFLGGGEGQSGELIIQLPDGGFGLANEKSWERYIGLEDTACVLQDLDGDGDLDLVLGHSSDSLNREQKLSVHYNNGAGIFTESTRVARHTYNVSSLCVGTIQENSAKVIFIGGGNIPGQYPSAPKSRIFIQEEGEFVPNSTWTMNFSRGLIKDAEFADLDGDGDQDLVVLGEWMPLTIYWNNGEEFEIEEIPETRGWWYSLEIADLNNDGKLDILAGNVGENNKFHPSLENPLYLYTNDFDNNGKKDLVLAKKGSESLLPVRGRECSSEQVPILAERFASYKDFAEATLVGIYGEDLLGTSSVHIAEEFSSCIFYQKDGMFRKEHLPKRAQISPIRDFLIRDLDNNGSMDIILVGNHFESEVETPRYDAGDGLVLLQNGGEFIPVPPFISGFNTPFDSRKIALLTCRGTPLYLVANNGGQLQVFMSRSAFK